jgi:hypothetical protein
MDPKRFIEKYEKDIAQYNESFDNIASILERHSASIKRLVEQVDVMQKEQDAPVVESPPVAPEDKDVKIAALEAELAELKAKLAAVAPVQSGEQAPSEEPEKKEQMDEPENKKESEEEPEKKKESEEEKPEKPKMEKAQSKSPVDGSAAKTFTLREAFKNESSAREIVNRFFGK